MVPGQKASVDTRNGIVAARVIRVDPAVQNGTVTVDIALVGELPKGARPDLTVDGTIELERLRGRGLRGAPRDGPAAEHDRPVPHRQGHERGAARAGDARARRSVSTIEVKEGLEVGDEVILSDTSAWDSADRIRLN